MSKIRQAVRYERRAAKAQDAAHRQLALTEHLATKELLQQADSFERKFTDGQFSQLTLVAQEHRLFHEREHLLYEDAIEKASTALSVQLAALQTEFDRMREDSHNWLPVGRFEREHKQLIEKMETDVANLDAKLDTEERVTIREQGRNEVLDSMATTRRWLIGLSIAFLFSAISTVALIIEHLA